MRRRLGERRASEARRRGLCSTCCWSSERGDGGVGGRIVPTSLSNARRSTVGCGGRRFPLRCAFELSMLSRLKTLLVPSGGLHAYLVWQEFLSQSYERFRFGSNRI